MHGCRQREAGSGVARVPCALGQEIFLPPCQQKVQSLKWKLLAKIWKMQNFFFDGNKPRLVLEMNFDKVVIVGGSNNAGAGGFVGGQRVFGGGAPDAETIFYIFFQKIRIFKHTLV